MKSITGKLSSAKPNLQNIPMPKTEEGQRILAAARAGWEERARARAAWIRALSSEEGPCYDTPMGVRALYPGLSEVNIARIVLLVQCQGGICAWLDLSGYTDCEPCKLEDGDAEPES